MDLVEVSVLFSHTEVEIPPRCRNYRLVRYDTGRVTATYRSVSAAEAPVALRCNVPAETADVPDPVAIDYRWFDNRLWASISIEDCKPSSRTVFQNSWDVLPIPELLDLRTGVRDLHPCFYGIAPGFTNSLATVANVHAAFDGFILVDGVPHICVAEPCFYVRTFGLGSNHGGTALFAGDFSPVTFHDAGDNLFNVCDLSYAIAYGEKVAIERGDTKSLPMHVNGGQSFEVFMTDVLKVRRAVQGISPGMAALFSDASWAMQPNELHTNNDSLPFVF